MRIAQVSTVFSPVRRDHCGSVEQQVWLLTRELIRLGHDVSVFGTAGSEVDGKLIPTLPAPYGEAGSPADWQVCEWVNLCRAVEHSGQFDVLHSHAYLWGLPLEPLSRAPMVHTFHVVPGEDQARLWSMSPGACVTSLSKYQWSAFPDLCPAVRIYHGVDPAHFTFRAEPEDYVCYLGRFIPGKGPVEAIATAKALGLRLLLAGGRGKYFRSHVEPLVDGRGVVHVGPVNAAERDRFLGGARALLYPVNAPEPFGLVLIEAMMCGVPVAAMPVGAVTEIVEEGVTGSCATSADDFPQAVVRAMALDRRRVRERAVSRFSAQRMAQEYAQLYERLTSGRKAVRPAEGAL